MIVYSFVHHIHYEMFQLLIATITQVVLQLHKREELS